MHEWFDQAKKKKQTKIYRSINELLWLCGCGCFWDKFYGENAPYAEFMSIYAIWRFSRTESEVEENGGDAILDGWTELVV